MPLTRMRWAASCWDEEADLPHFHFYKSLGKHHIWGIILKSELGCMIISLAIGCGLTFNSFNYEGVFLQWPLPV